MLNFNVVLLKSTLHFIWKNWLKVSEFIGNIMSRVILTVLYFTIFSVPGVASRLITDKLQVKKDKITFWIDASNKVPQTLEESRKQG